jgi:SAM-dependent methyltransferase
MYGIENKSHLGGYIVGLTDFGDPNTYATEVWDWMIDNNIKSVLDVGCGEGHSTKYFLEKGIHSIGIEGGEKAYTNSLVKSNLILHDFVESPFIPNEVFDAIWCCEFVEHVEEQFSENFLKTFDFGKKIFMTHAVVGQEGYHHVNCQNSDYWIKKIEARGFVYNHELSIFLRSITNKLHIKNTLIVFEKK